MPPVLHPGCLCCARRAVESVGTTLYNEYLRVVLAPSGSLQKIENLAAGESYSIDADAFTLLTDRGRLSNQDAAPMRGAATAEGEIYAFSLPGCCEVTLTYRLRPGRRYLERHVSVTNGPRRLLLDRIELGRTMFATGPREVIPYDTFWYAPTATFLRWEKDGLLSGIENPFFETETKDRENAFAFEPALWLEPGEVYRRGRRNRRPLAAHCGQQQGRGQPTPLPQPVRSHTAGLERDPGHAPAT